VHRPFNATLESVPVNLRVRALVAMEMPACGHLLLTRRRTLRNILLKFGADQSGATAIEYGLIAAGIALAIIAAVNGLGSTLNTNFTSINSSLK
jgi:pilus assembly protein Flp/PilA